MIDADGARRAVAARPHRSRATCRQRGRLRSHAARKGVQDFGVSTAFAGTTVLAWPVVVVFIPWTSDFAPVGGALTSGLVVAVVAALASGLAVVTAVPVLPVTEPVAGAVMAVGSAVLAVVGACWAKALIGRIAKVEATSRLEIRVIAVFLSAGGLPGCNG